MASATPHPKVHLRRTKPKRRLGLWTFACGEGYYHNDEPGLTWQQFVWLPKERQCGRCLNAWHGRDRHVHVLVERRPVSATEEMIMAVEAIVFAFHLIFRVEHEHRCYHRPYKHVEGLTRCTWHSCRGDRADFIGQRSWLDVVDWWYPVPVDEKLGCLIAA